MPQTNLFYSTEGPFSRPGGSDQVCRRFGGMVLLREDSVFTDYCSWAWRIAVKLRKIPAQNTRYANQKLFSKIMEYC